MPAKLLLETAEWLLLEDGGQLLLETDDPDYQFMAVTLASHQPGQQAAALHQPGAAIQSQHQPGQQS